MNDVMIGTILPKTFKNARGKWFFYLWDGKNKVAVILTDEIVDSLEIPQDYEGKIKVEGKMTYNATKKILKLYASRITKFDTEIDYRAQIRELLAQT